MGLMGNTIRNVEDIGAESNVDYDSLVQEVSEERNISKWPRDCYCDIFGKECDCFMPLAKVCPRIN